MQYEIIVQAKDGTYEIEIDKATGKVLEVEKEGANDEDDRHDDDDDDRYEINNDGTFHRAITVSHD